ncbi:MAG TPA: hypothetical protein PLV62_09090 [Spirochaetota bacterium]|nr:hypothetical protein [Spirochaetales bacterium]HPK45121.1 hypothetical protein [Spirochaetota bacterium]HRV27290.1 hypothetical protein [Spirochaetia bacterium]HOT58719.1 hypothetical protein [Spirochaetales bacterium]HPD80755.1 hypothetical protein [Spirochaetales bacterium]
MNQQLYRAAMIAVIMFTVPQIFCEPLSQFTAVLQVSSKPQKIEKSLTTDKTGSVNLTLLPNHQESQRIQTALQLEKPDFVIEALMFYPGKIAMNKLFTILHAAGSMQGITYYSNSKKKVRVLYEESWIINNLQDKKKLSDPIFTTVPAQTSFMMWQKDATLGGIAYTVTLQSGTNWITSTAHNVSTVVYGIVPIIQPEHLMLRYLAIQTDEGILFYAVMSVRPLVFPGINDRYISSLQNRITAVYSWLETKLYE